GRTPGRGGQPRGGGPVPAARQVVRVDRRVVAGPAHPVLPAAVAGLETVAAQAVLPRRGVQAGHRPGVGTPADDPPRRRRTVARHGIAGLVCRAPHSGTEYERSPTQVAGREHLADVDADATGTEPVRPPAWQLALPHAR